ncbi:MAG TPA: hypothetical protein VMU85_18880, partial [Stellaceae bacterium]|nr:hypothetical protein [Stellaceae bacterium]
MSSEALLREISEYCRQVGMAESTFGRLAVNDGKLVSRLRFGGRVTTETAERVRAFMAPREREHTVLPAPARINGSHGLPPVAAAAPAPTEAESAQRNFRFYDNRQKYL